MPTFPMPHANAHTTYESLLRANQARLARIARHYAGQADWPDLLQEISLQLWRSHGGFDGRSDPATWVYRIALNTAISWRRKTGAAPIASQLAEHHDPIGHTGPGDELVLLDEFLAALDPVNRAVLMLDLDGLAREQIADVLGLTPGAVAVRMTRLRQTFEQRYVENP